MGLRDGDVHLASTGAEPLPKYIPAEPRHHQPYQPMPVIPGTRVLIEKENPDGTKVSGPGLRATVGLYIEQQGGRVEAATACREFIDQLGSLLDAMKRTWRQD